MKESLITKLPTNELMNPSQKKKRKHRQVLDKLVLFLKCNQIRCFLCQRIPGNPHLAPICAHVLLSHGAAGAAAGRWPWPSSRAAALAGGSVVLQPQARLEDRAALAVAPGATSLTAASAP